jgi:hypothetical protein
MAHPTASGGASPAPDRSRLQNVQPTEQTAWVGWIAFAGFMMVMLGAFHAIQGLVAIFEDEYFLVGRSGLTLSVDFTTWGWIHVIGGVIIVAAGIALFVGKGWARATGVVCALASAVANIGFLPAYPVWSAMMIAVDVVVIWAITVHGSEMRK